MFGQWTYLGLLLPWGVLVVAVQWAVSAGALARRLRLIALTVVPATVYLTGCDSVALAQGIWNIHSDRIVGVYLGNVPLEEALFFLLTNLMVVQGLILLSAPEPRRALRSRLGRGGAR